MVMHNQMADLLEHVDVPGQWEAPADFRYVTAVERFRRFHSDLEAETGVVLKVDVQIQDASYHAGLILQGGELRFSNFGCLIALTPDHAVPADTVAAIERLASRHSYVFVPTELLERPYPRAVPGISTWWIRYFDYL